MKRTVALLTATLLAASFAPASARVASCKGVRPQSVFGTVSAVNGLIFTLRNTNSAGDVTVRMPDNDIRSVDGATLRPGVFAGVWGCLPAQSQNFIAEEVTVSPSEATYPHEYRYSSRDTDRIYGRVDDVRPGRVLVHGTARRDTWVLTNQAGIVAGQTVRVIGYFQPDGTFVADTISVVR